MSKYITTTDIVHDGREFPAGTVVAKNHFGDSFDSLLSQGALEAYAAPAEASPAKPAKSGDK